MSAVEFSSFRDIFLAAYDPALSDAIDFLRDRLNEETIASCTQASIQHYPNYPGAPGPAEKYALRLWMKPNYDKHDVLLWLKPYLYEEYFQTLDHAATLDTSVSVLATSMAQGLSLGTSEIEVPETEAITAPSFQ